MNARRARAIPPQLIETIAADIHARFPDLPHASPREPSLPTVPLAIIDSVLSLNRPYNSFVVPRVRAFAEAHPKLVSVSEFARSMEPDPAIYFRREFNCKFPQRARILHGVAQRLAAILPEHPGETELERGRAWALATTPNGHVELGVSGFALAGYQYLRKLLGAAAIKPDVHIVRYVKDVLGLDKLTPERALRILDEASLQLNLDAAELDSEIWKAYSGSEIVVPELSDAALDADRRGAEAGDVASQHAMGLRYLDGIGVPKDLESACRWFRTAAEQGDAEAQDCLGAMYWNGDGVARDFSQARKWLERSAAQGHTPAMVSLGHMHRNGNGVPESEHAAVNWYRQAAEQGDPAGQLALGECYEEGHGLDKSESKAFECYRAAALSGDPDGQYALGQCHELGIGVECNESTALQWIKRAARQGHDEAREWMRELGAAGPGRGRCPS